MWSRVGPLLRVLDSAAVVRSCVAAAAGRAGGASGSTVCVVSPTSWTARAGSGRDLAADRAADLVWTLCAQANFDALVGQRGWTHREYESWLADMLAAALLPE